ncbi:MAG: hypothetical protein KAI73_11780 [Rhodospirillaceae bacterium]|nr:hypothetical protein [Rhodospirillaceae bacterium]
MSSPKGTSKHPQSAMYKDGGSKLVEQSDVETHKADGWCDNPAEETPVDAKAPAAPEAEETEPAEDPGEKPEGEPAELEPAGKGLMGSLKNMVSGGDSAEEPEIEEGSTDEPEA